MMFNTLEQRRISLHIGVPGVHVFALLVSQLEKAQNQQIAQQQQGRLVMSAHG
jgi:hypothetical protein